MSKYTTELRYVVESGYNLTALEEYPIFDENYRPTLNSIILNHFWMREIGFETAGLFNHYLKTTLNEIMPYYNGLFKMSLEQIDPLTNYKYTETTERKDESVSTSTNDSQSNYKNVESVPADGLVQMNEIEQNVYANSATLSNDSNSRTGRDTNALESTYVKTISGYNGVSLGKLMDDYRKYMKSVAYLLVNDKDLNKCFMGVY